MWQNTLKRDFIVLKTNVKLSPLSPPKGENYSFPNS